MAQKAIVGEKVGMTQVWGDDQRVVPVTVLRIEPARIVQVKTGLTDGYTALQVTYGQRDVKKLNKAEAGHFAPKSGVRNVAAGRRLVELRLDSVEGFEIGQEILIPLKNGEGGYVADEKTLDELEGEGRVIARYLEINPNGSRRDIAGITNARGNVVGIMPHPEHAVEKLTGPTTDGLGFFTSLLSSLVNNGKVSA